MIWDAPVYRGHSDPDWTLETTLERRIGNMPVEAYYRHVRRTQSEISSVTGKIWDIPNPAEIENRFRDYGPRVSDLLPAPEYLAYLRHYGFPSPLLDWTRSPFIAAFFAFRRPLSQGQDSVCIYVLDNVPSTASAPTCITQNLPVLWQVGRFVATDRRHFQQQSIYTACVRFAEGSWTFCNHEEVLKTRSAQNLRLTKCLLPASERHSVLKRFDSFNLNSYSLFGTYEAMMETLANREFGQ